MKILHGMREVAGQAYYSVKGLRAHNYEAVLVLWDVSPFGYPIDKCLNIDFKNKKKYPWYFFKMGLNMIWALARYDTFHFHFGHSLLPYNLDLWILKCLKKNLFFEFHGSDLRQGSIAILRNPYTKEMEFSDETKLKKRAEKLLRYANGIVIHDDEQLPHIPLESKKVHLVPLRMDLSKFSPVYPEAGKTKITIVHAPSKRKGKGSRFILSAVERLSNHYDIDFILVEGMTQEEAFEQYKKADIIVDQIIVGTYGVFAIEAMALGKPVITYITDEMKQKLPEELPIVSANPDNVEVVLEELIQNETRRIELGKRGGEYVRKYHDCYKNAKILIDIYEGKHVPIFGRQAFEEAANQ